MNKKKICKDSKNDEWITDLFLYLNTISPSNWTHELALYWVTSNLILSVPSGSHYLWPWATTFSSIPILQNPLNAIPGTEIGAFFNLNAVDVPHKQVMYPIFLTTINIDPSFLYKKILECIFVSLQLQGFLQSIMYLPFCEWQEGILPPEQNKSCNKVVTWGDLKEYWLQILHFCSQFRKDRLYHD